MRALAKVCQECGLVMLFAKEPPEQAKDLPTECPACHADLTQVPVSIAVIHLEPLSASVA